MQSRPLSDDHCCHLHRGWQFGPIWQYLIYWRDRIDGSFSDYMVRRIARTLGCQCHLAVSADLHRSLASQYSGSLGQMPDASVRQSLSSSHRPGTVDAACRRYLQWALIPRWRSIGTPPAREIQRPHGDSLTFFHLLLLNAARRPLERRWFPSSTAAETVAGGLLCFITAGFSETLSIALFVGLSIVLGALRLQRGVMWRRCKAILVAGWLAIDSSACR